MYGVSMSNADSSHRAGLSSNGIRQVDEKPDNFASLPSSKDNDNDSMEHGWHFKYTRLTNRSPSIYTNDSNTEENVSETAFGVKLSKSDSDQKIPDTVIRVDDMQSRNVKCATNQKDLFCNDILLEVYKNNKDMLKSNLPGSHYQMDRLSVNRSVPNANDHLNLSFNTLNLEEADHHHVQRDMYGNVILNTSGHSQYSANDDNNSLEISYDHVKYINVFSLLCCWCFPFTGIISVIYARLTSKYFKMRDLTRAKRYLEKSEWMLILTFFFGFTLIALGFCFLEYYWFKSDPSGSKSATRHFPYHLAKKFQ